MANIDFEHKQKIKRMSETNKSWGPLISKIMQELSSEGVELDEQLTTNLVLSFIQSESGGDELSIGDKKKAVGLMQLWADAAKEGGIDPDDRNVPEKNLRAGITFLNERFKEFPVNEYPDPKIRLDNVVLAYSSSGSLKNRIKKGGVPANLQARVDTLVNQMKDIAKLPEEWNKVAPVVPEGTVTNKDPSQISFMKNREGEVLPFGSLPGPLTGEDVQEKGYKFTNPVTGTPVRELPTTTDISRSSPYTNMRGPSPVDELAATSSLTPPPQRFLPYATPEPSPSGMNIPEELAMRGSPVPTPEPTKPALRETLFDQEARQQYVNRGELPQIQPQIQPQPKSIVPQQSEKQSDFIGPSEFIGPLPQQPNLNQKLKQIQTNPINIGGGGNPTYSDIVNISTGGQPQDVPDVADQLRDQYVNRPKNLGGDTRGINEPVPQATNVGRLPYQDPEYPQTQPTNLQGAKNFVDRLNASEELLRKDRYEDKRNRSIPLEEKLNPTPRELSDQTPMQLYTEGTEPIDYIPQPGDISYVDPHKKTVVPGSTSIQGMLNPGNKQRQEKIDEKQEKIDKQAEAEGFNTQVPEPVPEPVTETPVQEESFVGSVDELSQQPDQQPGKFRNLASLFLSDFANNMSGGKNLASQALSQKALQNLGVVKPEVQKGRYSYNTNGEQYNTITGELTGRKFEKPEKDMFNAFVKLTAQFPGLEMPEITPMMTATDLQVKLFNQIREHENAGKILKELRDMMGYEQRPIVPQTLDAGIVTP